jgi:hypothetical protein
VHPATATSVNTTLPPAQKVVGPPAEILALGFLITLTKIVVDSAVPHALVVTQE